MKTTKLLKTIPLLFTLLLAACQPEETAMKRVFVENGELEYEVQGTGEPILFIHGSAIADTFSVLMPEKSLADYQLIRYHRRGFSGSSYPTEGFSMQDQAADASALLKHLGIQKAHIVGHSYGGSIAFQLGLDSPELVHSLVVLEPAILQLPGGGPPPEALISSIGQYQSGDPEGAIDSFLKWADAEDWEAICEAKIPGGPAQVKRDAKNFFEVEVPALNQWMFGEKEASKISQPILYLTGNLSNSKITACKPFLKSWIPQLDTRTVKGVSHSLHLQKPKVFSEVIAGFLNTNPI